MIQTQINVKMINALNKIVVNEGYDIMVDMLLIIFVYVAYTEVRRGNDSEEI